MLQSKLTRLCQHTVKLYSRLFSVGKVSFDSVHDYAESGDCAGIEKELNSGINLDMPDARKWTPLMVAASKGHVNVIKMLIDRSCNLDIINRTGQTAMDLSAFYNQKDAYDLLKSNSRKYSDKTGIGYNKQGNISYSEHIEQASLWTGIDRCADIRTDSSRLDKLIKSDGSIFIVFINGLPVVAPDCVSGRTRLLRLSYSQIERYLDSKQCVFLGVGRNILTNRADCVEELPIYFAVDIPSLDKASVNKLSAKAEILPRLSIMFLEEQDVALIKQARPLLDWSKRHEFCATCSATTVVSEAGYKRVCSNKDCSTNADIHNTSYPRVDPTVISPVISSDGQRVLLARKAMFPTGMFSCLAGFVEPGESLEQACAREVHEEVGVCVDTVCYHSSQFWPMPSHLMVGFLAYVADDGQEIKVDKKELEAARWFDRSEVVQMQTLSHADGLFTPPRQAIAHRLLKTWLLESAFK